MDIRLLGDVEIEHAGATFGLERAAERCVLATLAFNVGRVVPLGTFVDHIWGGRPPAKAEESVASYVRTVRRTIERAGGSRECVPNRRLDGYRLDVDPDVVDHRRFVDLSTAARMAVRQGDTSRAVEAFERALLLWRGEALANVSSQWADGRRYRLRRERLDVTYELLDLLSRTGAHAAVAGRAADLVEEEPTERAIALAIRGLAGSGQRVLIPSFMARAAGRMRELSGDQPSGDLVALARSLVDPPAVEEDVAEAPPAESGGVITMTATNSVNVFQAAGDQYIVE